MTTSHRDRSRRSRARAAGLALVAASAIGTAGLADTARADVRPKSAFPAAEDLLRDILAPSPTVPAGLAPGTTVTATIPVRVMRQQYPSPNTGPDEICHPLPPHDPIVSVCSDGVVVYDPGPGANPLSSTRTGTFERTVTEQGTLRKIRAEFSIGCKTTVTTGPNGTSVTGECGFTIKVGRA